MLKTYIQALKEAAEAQTHSGSKGTSVWRGQPLTTQIQAFLRTLPPAQRDRWWSIDEFVCRLEGKYRDRPHPADVGRALRALGWVRVRDCSRVGAGKRYWTFSPEDYR